MKIDRWSPRRARWNDLRTETRADLSIQNVARRFLAPRGLLSVLRLAVHRRESPLKSVRARLARDALSPCQATADSRRREMSRDASRLGVPQIRKFKIG